MINTVWYPDEIKNRSISVSDDINEIIDLVSKMSH